MTEKKEKTRIVFMGTPDFAVHILEALVKEKMNIVGVVTVADKPAGRGKKLQMSAVKSFALEQNLKVLTPLKLKDPVFLAELKELRPDLQIVVAFRMLPEVIWSLPPMGTFNLHASLLPQYRGAAPINHAIINGESRSGVTTFFLDHKIDTGKIIMRKECDIEPEDTAGDLHDKLMRTGANLVLETIKGIENNSLVPVDQSEFENELLKDAPKIFKDDCQIRWDQPAQKIYDFVRGLSPYPGAHTFLAKNNTEEAKTVKIFKMQLTNERSEKSSGCIWSEEKNELLVSTRDFNLKILELQMQGKKRMKTVDFLRGFPIIESMRFVEK